MNVTDTAVGFILLGVGMVVVLGVVFVIASRVGRPATPPATPPRGVHMPGPSYLPIVLSVSAALLGAALAFRPEGWVANPFLAVPGLLVLVAGAVAWVRAAGREWRDTEHRAHDDGSAH